MGVGDWFQTSDLRGLDSKTSYRFYVGSYGRSTAIPSVSDVDLLYELPNELYARFNGHAGNGQSALLAHVHASIMKIYSVTEIGGDGQVVVLRFDDGVKFEVLPAFLNAEGGKGSTRSNSSCTPPRSGKFH